MLISDAPDRHRREMRLKALEIALRVERSWTTSELLRNASEILDFIEGEVTITVTSPVEGGGL